MDLTAFFQTVQRNPVLAGGAGIGIAGSLFASLRSLPNKAWGLAKNQFMISADVMSGDQSFYWLKQWLDEQPSVKRSRNVSASVLYGPSQPGETQKGAMSFTPAPGAPHFMRHKGRYLWITRTREKQASGYNSTPTESFTIQTIGRDPNIIRDLFADVERTVNAKENRYQTIFLQDGSCWEEFTKKRPRPLDSVVLPKEHKDTILADIKQFLDNKQWYDDLGLPYRRGYLFYGPPGSGKSSLTAALAGEIKRDLYVLSLAARNLDDQGLLKLMGRVPADGVLLIEDIDAAFDARETKDEHASRVTFSGLLNALDGVGSRDGQIVVMSTNHREKLDPALIRPGRVDFQALLGNATPEQASTLYERFFPDSGRAAEFARSIAFDQVSMASLQNHLVRFRDEDEAIAMAAKLQS